MNAKSAMLGIATIAFVAIPAAAARSQMRSVGEVDLAGLESAPEGLI